MNAVLACLNMVARLAAALVFALATSSAWAQAYVGLALGQARYIDPCAGAAGSISCSGNDTALRIFGGYRFSRYISVELGGGSLGTIRASSGESADLEAIDLSALVSWPLGNRFALYGRLGVYSGDMSVTGGNTPVPPVFPPPPPPPSVGWVQGSSVGATYGLGASYEMTEHVALRLDWQRFDQFGGGDSFGFVGPTFSVDVFSIGAVLRF